MFREYCVLNKVTWQAVKPDVSHELLDHRAEDGTILIRDAENNKSDASKTDTICDPPSLQCCCTRLPH